MDLHSEEDMTFTYPTTRRPFVVLTHGLAPLTVHREDTAIGAPSPKHSCMEEVTNTLHLKKLKLSTKQRKNVMSAVRLSQLAAS